MKSRQGAFYRYTHIKEHYTPGDEMLAIALLWSAIADFDYQWLASEAADEICIMLGMNRDKIEDLLLTYGG